MTNPSGEHFPFIENLEEALLKSFLQNRKMWVDFKDEILNNYFNTKDHTNVFKILKVFFDKYKEFPSMEQCLNIAVKKEYGDETLSKIKQIYTRSELKVKEIDFLYDECAEFIKDNKIKNAILEGVDLLEKRKNTNDEAIRKNITLEIEDKIRQAATWSHSVELGTDMQDVEKRYKELELLNEQVLSSPWRGVNLALGGGAFAKELVLCGASSSVGKTIFLDNWATFAWRNLKKNVLSITLEISEIRKSQRMDAEMRKIPSNEIITRKNEVFKFYKEETFEQKLMIKEFPTSAVNLNHLRQYTYQLELYTGFKPDVIFVDYLDIMLPTKRTQDDYTDQGRVGAELRGWGIELGVPIISATQLNRAAKTATIDELGEEFLADSWKKMMIADAIVFIANTPEERTNGRINAKVAKARNGQKDIILPLRVDYPTLRIFDPNKK